MSKPNQRVNAFYEAYRISAEKNKVGSPLSKEQFLDKLVRGLNLDRVSLYIVTGRDNVPLKLKLNPEEAAKKDEELRSKMEAELSKEEYARWKKEGGAYTHRAALLEQLYRLDDLGYRFIREEQTKQGRLRNEFVHFHKHKRNDPGSFPATGEWGRPWEVTDHKGDSVGSIMRKKDPDKAYVPGAAQELPEPEWEYLYARIRKLRRGLESYRGAYVADRKFGKCRKVPLIDWENDFLSMNTAEKSEIPWNKVLDNRETVLKCLAGWEDQLRKLHKMKLEGSRFIKVKKTESEEVIQISTTGDPLHMGFEKPPAMDLTETRKPAPLPWYKTKLTFLSKTWRRDVEEWNRVNARYQEALSRNAQIEEKGEKYKEELDKAFHAVRDAREKEEAAAEKAAAEKAAAEKTAEAQAAKLAEGEKKYPVRGDKGLLKTGEFLNALTEVMVCGITEKQMQGVFESPCVVPTEKTPEGRSKAIEAALRCARKSQLRDMTETFDHVAGSLAFYNMCFRGSDLRGQNALDSCQKIREGLALMEKLRAEFSGQYQLWVKDEVMIRKDMDEDLRYKPAKRVNWERIEKECKGALAMVEYVKKKENSLDVLLKTEKGSESRKTALKDLLVPYLMQEEKALNYKWALSAGKGELSSLIWMFKAGKTQSEAGGSDDPEKKMMERHNSYGARLEETPFYTMALNMSQEALTVILVGADGKLREDTVKKAVDQVLDNARNQVQENQARKAKGQKDPVHSEPGAVRDQSPVQQTGLG